MAKICIQSKFSFLTSEVFKKKLIHSLTLEILKRGQISQSYQDSFSHPHRFEKHAYTTPTHCNMCGNLLWGPVRNGVRCMDCGNAYHVIFFLYIMTFIMA
jgi:Phorbol esters/diacylglycerol binding domain (C1 domain)